MATPNHLRTGVHWQSEKQLADMRDKAKDLGYGENFSEFARDAMEAYDKKRET